MPAYFWVLAHAIFAFLCVYHALLYKRDPRSAMGWIMACIFIPYAGPISYSLFGVNRVRSRARGLQRRFFDVRYEIGDRKPLTECDYCDGIGEIGHRITGRVITEGNDVLPLINGDATYASMLAAIKSARRRILLATYIMKTDNTGERFAEALEQAIGRGVDVKVLIDGFGNLYSWRRMSTRLKKSGIETAKFFPPRLLPPSMYLNLRNHRKILVVDNQVAYAGGMNISDEHATSDGRERLVSDMHFELHGPVINELAQLFYHDWQYATGNKAPLKEFPAQSAKGTMSCRIIPDSPDTELDVLAITIETVISSATRSVDIMTPYFVPTRELMAALQSASLRGVKVRIVLPQKNNFVFMNWANRNLLAELLRWNISAYYQPPPFCHSKLLCIDDEYVLIGSANLDPRSLRLNFELGIEVFSKEFNSQISSHFDEVVAFSTPISFEALAQRSILIRLRDSAAALMSPYL